MAQATDGITYADLVALGLTRTPDRVAFVSGDGPVSYRSLAGEVFRLARAMAGLGLVVGDGVACLAPNRPEAFMVSAAAHLNGCRYTPMNPYGSAEDQAFILRDAEIRLLVFDPSLETRADEIVRQSGCPLALSIGPSGAADLLALAACEPDSRFQVEFSDSAAAVLAYTGGSTGRPKGVMLPHRAVVQNVMMTLADWQLPGVMRTLLFTPLSHSAGTMVLPTLLRGGTVHLLPGFDPEQVLATIERERITTILGVPTVIYSLLDSPMLEQTDLSSLATFIYGSAPISPARLEEGLRRIGPCFMQLYAQTEAPQTVTVLRKEDHDLNRPELLASCGQVMTGVRVALLDDDGEEVAEGEDGEICVRSRLVMDGYWKQPEATAEALRGGWLHTGDVARRDGDGYMFIVDRKKDMIISGGYNVYPREVEDVLSAHPGVARVAVIGVPHERWGEAVTAIIVPRPGMSVTSDELIQLVRDQKGSIQAPKSVEFLEALPLTPVGKIDKPALRRRYWEGRGRMVN